MSFEEQVLQTVETLRKGGVILYPTDTVWGLGCDATNDRAVARIYDIKRSADKKSMLVLLDSLDKVSLYVQKVPDIAWQLFEVAEKPLTLILPEARGVAANLVPEEGTLGIRVPEHDFCRAVIRRLNRPLVSTSANVSGRPAPATPSEIAAEITSAVDLVVDPAFEGRPTRKASSIIKVGKGGEIEIIRK